RTGESNGGVRGEHGTPGTRMVHGHQDPSRLNMRILDETGCVEHRTDWHPATQRANDLAGRTASGPSFDRVSYQVTVQHTPPAARRLVRADEVLSADDLAQLCPVRLARSRDRALAVRGCVELEWAQRGMFGPAWLLDLAGVRVAPDHRLAERDQ